MTVPNTQQVKKQRIVLKGSPHVAEGVAIKEEGGVNMRTDAAKMVFFVSMTSPFIPFKSGGESDGPEG